jgi:uncharacterized protein
VLVLVVLVSTALADAAETPIPPSPTEWVTDTANFLSPEAVRLLNARLAAYEQATGHQLIVYIAPTTGDAPIEDWAVRAFAKWKVGRKGLDDGLAVFIMAQDHKMRIEVGYGLEAVVPDAIASRVINEVMAPRIQAGHPDDAVAAAIDALTGVTFYFLASILSGGGGRGGGGGGGGFGGGGRSGGGGASGSW